MNPTQETIELGIIQMETVCGGIEGSYTWLRL